MPDRFSSGWSFGDDADPSWSFDSADYELRWPRELFHRELTALRRAPAGDDRRAWTERLLEEVFLGEAPRKDFTTARGQTTQYLDALLDQVPLLREHHAPRAYWSARRGAARQRPERDSVQLYRGFAETITALQADGYLDQVFPAACVDDPLATEPNPGALLSERLGADNLWPLRPSLWDQDMFFDLVEVFHDLVARPRSRRYHSWNQCGWHYGHFSVDTGRALYRWRINTLLETGGVDLRLADNGEDIGRLIRHVDDGREDLIENVFETPDRGVGDRIRHAVALFRARTATDHDKRSAVITLAGVLEERRPLIHTELGRADEGALFSLANNFAIRHQRRGQQPDYDPVFLDWMFWWYLATIELTDRILARDDFAPHSGTTRA